MSRLFTIFADLISIFQTISISGKFLGKFQDFFKNSRLYEPWILYPTLRERSQHVYLWRNRAQVSVLRYRKKYIYLPLTDCSPHKRLIDNCSWLSSKVQSVDCIRVKPSFRCNVCNHTRMRWSTQGILEKRCTIIMKFTIDTHTLCRFL